MQHFREAPKMVKASKYEFDQAALARLVEAQPEMECLNCDGQGRATYGDEVQNCSVCDGTGQVPRFAGLLAERRYKWLISVPNVLLS